MFFSLLANAILDPVLMLGLAGFPKLGVAGAALAKHGGNVESATGDFTILDGTPDTEGVAALLSFPDKDAAVAWSTDPALADVHALRRSAGGSDILLLG